MKTKSKVILLNERQQEMLQMLQYETGMSNTSAVIYMCIDEVYSRRFPAYKVNNLKSTAGGTEMLELKAKNKMRSKAIEIEEKENIRKEKKRQICTTYLFGETRGEGDDEVCAFNTYFADGHAEEQVIPIMQCDVSLADNNLFIPSKEIVLERNPKLAKKFKN